MKIGELARAANMGVETVRYYQRQGLLRVPDRPLGGTRTYTESDMQRLHFIQRAKALGFSLKDVARLLELTEADCENVQAMASEKLAQVRSKLAQLRSMETALDGTLAKCRERGSDRECPIIESLNEFGS